LTPDLWQRKNDRRHDRARSRSQSIDRKFPVDRAQIRRPDETRMGDGHRIEKAFEIAGPKIQELPQFREMRMQVMLLPNVILQDPGMIGQGGRGCWRSSNRILQAGGENQREPCGFSKTDTDNVVIPNSYLQLEVPKKRSDIRMLSAKRGEC
jgi:hypothetical protein